MAETLSQAEIDALREAVASGDVMEEGAAEERGREQVKVATYDFRKPRLVSAEQQGVLRMVHESMAKDFQAALVASLKTPMEIKVVAIDQISYSEYILSLTNPTYLVLLSTSSAVGECVLEISTSVVSAVLDLMLGGDGGGAEQTRELTALEVKMFRSVTKGLLRELGTAWSGTCDVKFDIMSEESNPEYVQLATPETPCLSVTFDVHVGEAEGVFNFCYPFGVIQALFAKSVGRAKGGGHVEEQGGKNHEMLKAMEVVPLDLRAVVGSGRISAERLGHLKAGDVLCLDRRYDEPLDMYVGANLSYRVRAGRRHGNVAVDVAAICGEPEVNGTKKAADAKAPVK